VWKHYSISNSLCFKGNCKRMESEGFLRQVEGNFIAVLWILYILGPWSSFLLQQRQRTRNSCRRLNRQETEQEINCFVLYKPRISTDIILCIIMANWNSHCLALQLIHVERRRVLQFGVHRVCKRVLSYTTSRTDIDIVS